MNALTPLQSRLLKYFLERVHIEVPSVDTDLFEAGALDSLAFVDLLLYMEQEFGIKVSFDDLELDNFRSINKIAEFLANRDHMQDTAQEVS
jgi:D-alanine--poly(phosphoribitol) ligase subunit 2